MFDFYNGFVDMKIGFSIHKINIRKPYFMFKKTIHMP